MFIVFFRYSQTLQKTEYFFWATHTGAELDLFFLHQGRRYGVEIKFNEAPKMTRSMQIALQDLHLEQLWVIYPGHHTYPLHGKITVLPLRNLSILSDHLERNQVPPTS